MSLPGRTKEQPVGDSSIRGRADRAEAAEPVADPVERQHPGRHPGADPAAELDPGGAGVEPGAGRVGEAGALEPDPALGVLGAPVVADHPRPAGDLDRLAADLERPLEARVGERGDELGPRQRRLVEPVGRQVAAGLGVAGEAQRPGGGESPRPSTEPARPARPDLGVGDPDPGARRGTDSSLAGTVTLVARGPAASRSNSVNQIEPVGSAPGRLWTVWRIQIPEPPPGRQALT